MGVAGGLVARDLSVTYRASDRPALDRVSFALPHGFTLLVVGPSGSGKSTLALALAGLIPRDVPALVEGSLELGGTPVAALDPTALAARVGLVFQDPATQLVMERAGDDVAFGLENRAWPVRRMHARVPEALAEVGLGGSERRRSRRLSGGQQQRLALAGVLAPLPEVIVLDEPTANLDPPGADDFLERLRALRDERATTLILIEHRVEQAWPLADVVLALDGQGRPIDVGPPDAVAARSAQRMHDAGIWLPSEIVPGPQLAGRSARRSPSTVEPADGSAVGARRFAGSIEADGLTFAYESGRPVLRDVAIRIEAGERIALVGPNGGGKSTLARLLVGLLRPDAGTVRLGGDDPARLAPRALAQRAAYVFQEPERQFLAERVRDEILLGLDPGRHAAAEALMADLGIPLERFGLRSPFRLSGGEARRLSLAVALVRDPAVLVLDEPTFGQDRRTYESLLSILEGHLAAGVTLIAATHDPRFVTDVAERVVTMADGRIVADEHRP
ncbi:MAG TPA: ATP-binding cassette domain-containing protein [Candidatus Limnocylindrales bacterium]|nr:ATP-binding cassette domain-containing protein [Candidatus Limnocylindrales bacterium]